MNKSKPSTSSFFLLLSGLLVAINISDVNGQIEMNKETPQVQLTKPKQILRGTMLTSREDRPYYAFLGVRYANPPKRFEVGSRILQFVMQPHFVNEMMIRFFLRSAASRTIGSSFVVR